MKKLTMAFACLLAAGTLFGQTPQIPTLQVCNGTKATGGANVFLSKRVEPGKTGLFNIRISVTCDLATNGFPTGSVDMQFSLSDSSITNFRAVSIDQLTTTGKHTPTMYLNGRCMANGGTIPCHYWLTLSNNKDPNVAGTPDVVGVLVVDKTGKRLTYGTGPVRGGDINVEPTSN